jgi:hypothetical protein
MKFYVGDAEQEITDEAQGDSRQTQAEITKMIGMSHEMFKHIVALNTYTEPFLNLRANEQKAIIEQLLGITLLSEKADVLKELLKNTKDAIKEEEYRIKAEQEANVAIQEQINSLRLRQTMWNKKHNDDITSLIDAINELEKININEELKAHVDLAAFNTTSEKIKITTIELKRAIKDSNIKEKVIKQLKEDIVDLQDNKCHACGQELHEEKHEEVLAGKEKDLAEEEITFKYFKELVVKFKKELEELGTLGSKPETFYSTEQEAYQHKSSIDSLTTQQNDKATEEDPYSEQITEMEDQALKEIDYSVMNDLELMREHQDFLYKLLTNKDSFIRKRIIDQNLSYLNSRLSYYLDEIGLPHTVEFQSDLTVLITELGRDLDFDNLSRGERNRFILSLSWAFRDVYESLYGPINLLFIDELVDSGMDASGVEGALKVLKKMSRESNKSIWLVSHKDELAGRVNNILTVTKEAGFTSYGTDVDFT